MDNEQPLKLQLFRLPQELLNVIYDLTFTAEPGFRSIPKSQKGDIKQHPPRIMQVSRATRDKYAQSYYPNSVFIFSEPYACFAWLWSVPAEYRKLIRDIRYVAPDQEVKCGKATVVRLFWSSVLASRLEKGVAEVLSAQSHDELSRDMNGSKMLDERTP